MEYIMISDSKLKVMMDKYDFDLLNISAEELDYTNPEAKSAFEGIFEHAKEELGFDTSGHRILLQLFPSKDGGCELFITKLGKLSQSDSEHTKSSISKPKQKAYSFDSLSNLLSVCNHLHKKSKFSESSAFFDANGRWYLFLSCTNEFDEEEFNLMNEFTFISEYGHRENPDTLSWYLGEYGKEICAKNAIETLGKI